MFRCRLQTNPQLQGPLTTAAAATSSTCGSRTASFYVLTCDFCETRLHLEDSSSDSKFGKFDAQSEKWSNMKGKSGAGGFALNPSEKNSRAFSLFVLLVVCLKFNFECVVSASKNFCGTCFLFGIDYFRVCSLFGINCHLCLCLLKNAQK